MCAPLHPVVDLSAANTHQPADLEALMPVVLQVCRSWARSEQEAAELCQDAMLVAWRRREDWAQVGNLKSWVCGIARNLGRNARRKCREMWLDPELPDPACHRPGPDQLAVAAREIDAVRDALDQLPALERRVVQLRYAENWSAGQIDASLGLDGSGSRAVLQRGRRRLRRMLTDHTPEGARLAS